MRAGVLVVAMAVVLTTIACRKDEVPPPADGGSTGGASGGGGGAGGGGGISTGDAGLKWFTTCGDPVCPAPGFDAHRAMPDVAPCTTEQVGQPCATKDQVCDPHGDCNQALRCADHDPKTQTGGCPISSRRYKADITYLDAGERLRIADDLGKLRLARYKYKDDPQGRPHLGFILEDAPDVAAADLPHERVDLYGYLSMVVATLQTQREQLEAQAREIARLRKRLDQARGSQARDPR
jgi:hypothetical protein